MGLDPHRWEAVDNLEGIHKAASLYGDGSRVFLGQGRFTRTWKCRCGAITDVEPETVEP
jgi:hypothetical protein